MTTSTVGGAADGYREEREGGREGEGEREGGRERGK